MQGVRGPRFDAGRLHSQIDLISMQIRSTRRSRCLEGPVSATDRPKGLNPSRFHTLQARNERGSGPAADSAAERDSLGALDDFRKWLIHQAA
jgi:hypothetical protein